MIRGAVALVATLALVAASRPALADGTAPIRLGVVVDSTDALPLGPRVRGALRSLLEQDPRFRMATLDVGVLEEPAALRASDGAVQEAQRLFRGMDLDPAKAVLAKAIAGYEDELPALVARDGGTRALRDAHVLLAKCRFFEGNFDGAKDALRRAFVLDPKLTFSPALFPPQMKRAVVEARLLFDTLGSVTFSIDAEPAGATVILNGERVPGTVPLRLQVPAGPNAVVVVAPGYARLHKLVDLSEDAKLTARLEPQQTPAARARVAAVALEKGGAPVADLEAIASSMQADAVVLVHVSASSESRFRLSGVLYRRLKGKGSVGERLERQGPTMAIESEAEPLATALVEPLRARVHAADSDGDGRWARFRRSKAFWWVVGGVTGALVAGAAIGAGVGTYETQREAVRRETVLLGGR